MAGITSEFLMHVHASYMCTHHTCAHIMFALTQHLHMHDMIYTCKHDAPSHTHAHTMTHTLTRCILTHAQRTSTHGEKMTNTRTRT